jgi:endonuclease YncB( thermonuclease family)
VKGAHCGELHKRIQGPSINGASISLNRTRPNIEKLAQLCRGIPLYVMLIIGCQPLLAAEVTGVPDVVDGDTLRFTEVTVRLHGIDAAETGQRCIGYDKQITRPGELAINFLKDHVKHGIKCIGDIYDDYGRLVAKCYDSSGTDIDKALVKHGLAWAYVKYSDDYTEDESDARNRREGIWSMACQAPWEFRERRWAVAMQKAPEGCPIKGNISNNGRIYHVPWSRHYSRTRVDIAKGERWFCNEREALEAGWRAPVQ